MRISRSKWDDSDFYFVRINQLSFLRVLTEMVDKPDDAQFCLTDHDLIP